MAVFEDGEINVINNLAGKSITASVLFVPQNGSDIVVGDGARVAAAHAPGTLVYDAKRFICKRYDAYVVAREARGLPFAVTPVPTLAQPSVLAWLRLPFCPDFPSPHTGSCAPIQAWHAWRLCVLKRSASVRRSDRYMRRRVSLQAMSATRGQLESHLELSVDGQPLRFAPEHVGTLIVHHLKQAAEKHVGRKVNLAVLAVPVGFNAMQINAVSDAPRVAVLV